MSNPFQGAARANDGSMRGENSADEITSYLSTIPGGMQLETREQISRFELLRLALFVIKLRKLEKARSNETHNRFKRNLLQHAIFQQILTLTTLGERQQALQIVEAYRNQEPVQPPAPG